MSYEVDDTIAAIATAPGGAARGVVRISGHGALSCLLRCFTPRDRQVSLAELRVPQRVAGVLQADGSDGQLSLAIPGDLLVWPSTRSYTREPSAEFHTLSSGPLLAAVMEQLARVGVRPAEPGEFTLRAFLAGRIDLTEAEAVLGVIDARDRADLDAALDQLAGGLSRPLHQLREQLLAALAELEAGLDFAEEDIEFISREALQDRLQGAQTVIAATMEQLSTRDIATEVPRVVISGPPNAGKSSLFNALVGRYGESAAAAIVSPQPGATRDYVSARLNLNSVPCVLVDTAGLSDTEGDCIGVAAQSAATHQRRRADLRLICMDATLTAGAEVGTTAQDDAHDLLVLTKSDLAAAADVSVAAGDSILACSSLTGAGLGELAANVRERLRQTGSEGGGLAISTSTRCAGSLQAAQQALAAALELTEMGGDELIAAEIRIALDALGEVVGAISTDDVLDRVFSQFCIGK